MPVSSSPPARSCSASTKAVSTRSSGCSSRRSATRREFRGYAPHWRSRTAISPETSTRARCSSRRATPASPACRTTSSGWSRWCSGHWSRASRRVRCGGHPGGAPGSLGRPVRVHRGPLFGSVGHALALCEATLGRYDAAAERFASAWKPMKPLARRRGPPAFVSAGLTCSSPEVVRATTKCEAWRGRHALSGGVWGSAASSGAPSVSSG